MRRTLATLALAATFLGGTAMAADAKTKAPSTSGVKVCTTALKWAHDVPSSERRADRAVQICGLTVTSQKQANTLYRWAKAPANRWALDLIG